MGILCVWGVTDTNPTSLARVDSLPLEKSNVQPMVSPTWVKTFAQRVKMLRFLRSGDKEEGDGYVLLVVDLDLWVLRKHLKIRLDMLEPTTWLESLVHLTIQPIPVTNSTLEISNVDKVKGFRLKGPLELSIIDLKLNVWGDKAWLGWSDICSNNVG